MPANNQKRRDKKGVVSSSCDETPARAAVELKLVSHTAKDVARLAGVSTATVSRVTNGTGAVSAETRTRVLSAIAKLQYRPNSHAAELGRGKGTSPRKRGVRLIAMAGGKARRIGDPGAAVQAGRREAGQLRLLEKEYTRMMRAITKLSENLEKLRSAM
jgi:transcriptional regulator with XRE-family HTH domain